jgi:diguanylate cyclase (GGDEF)-like protein
VVDDEQGDLAVADAILSDDYEVICVDSGQRALAELERHPQAIVLCDQRMPTLTGDEVVARMRILYPDTIRILVTGYSDVAAIVRALNDGQIFGYLQKPYSPHELRALVERAVGHQAMILDNRRLVEENRRMRSMVERMVTERTVALEEENRKLKDIALVDDLTGLMNVRGLRARLAEEYERFLRLGIPFGIVMIDIDNFKNVNDTWGHPAGNEVLKAVAAALRRSIRGADVVGRYGGEEFVVMAAGSEEAGTAVLAERVRLGVAGASALVAPGKDLAVTVSVGVAACQPDGPPIEEVLRRADEAMYQAKRTGKNRTVTWTGLKRALATKPQSVFLPRS